MSFNGYVQVPPDSTGKKIAHGIIVELDYDNGSIDFELESTVVGQSSGITGKISKISGTIISGTIFIRLENTSVLVATIGENLRVNNVTHATAASTGAASVLYIPSVSISDHENPFQGQRVNVKGAASVTFAEGEPTLDAFGNLRVSQGRALAVYEHSQRDYGDLLSVVTGSGGSATHQPETATFLLSCNSTSGSYVSRTTNRYHYYLPGTGLTTILTLGLSDTGRNNNIRRWGYFDEHNGLFFELSGSVLNTVVRKTGVDTKTPQANWSSDKLDGTGLSGIQIDVSKENLYWIDMAWLGVGEVRFGVLKANGERVIANIHEHANTGIGPYMDSPHLPIRWENFNAAVTTGTSDIRTVCAAVYSDSVAEEDYTFWRSSEIESTGSGTTVTTRTPLFSVRNHYQNLLGSGINRVSAYPETLALFVDGGSVKLEIINDPQTITGQNWKSASISTVDWDNSGTALIEGSTTFKFVTLYYGSGTYNIDLKPYYELNDEALVLRANGDYRIYSYCLTKLSGSLVTARASLNIRELS